MYVMFIFLWIMNKVNIWNKNIVNMFMWFKLNKWYDIKWYMYDISSMQYESDMLIYDNEIILELRGSEGMDGNRVGDMEARRRLG